LWSLSSVLPTVLELHRLDVDQDTASMAFFKSCILYCMKLHNIACHCHWIIIDLL
jgi:hypothetical protein